MPEINPILVAVSNTSLSESIPSQVNPYNLVNIKTAHEVGEIAQKSIGSMPYRIATAGYSAPPEGYEYVTKQFLKTLNDELGVRSTAFVTSPTADKGSIDAITSEVAGMNPQKLFYVTCQDYVDYINPQNFPSTIDTTAYSKIAKHVLPDAAEYSKATAETSNLFIATGGRNVTVSDFVNAIKHGNKVIILENFAITSAAWSEAKGRVENASKYLSQQLQSFQKNQLLPYKEVGGLTQEFMQANKRKLGQLVTIINLENIDSKSILEAVKTAIKHIRL